MPTVLKLHPDDNVAVCIKTLAAGEDVLLDGQRIKMPAPLGIGHKLACKNISIGEPIIKYGIVIGTATTAIPKGSHVHTHNMKSNYIPTYLNKE